MDTVLLATPSRTLMVPKHPSVSSDWLGICFLGRFGNADLKQTQLSNTQIYDDEGFYRKTFSITHIYDVINVIGRKNLCYSELFAEKVWLLLLSYDRS